MTEPTARAISSVAACAACAVIGYAAPMFAAVALSGVMISMYLIWVVRK